jgi:sulfite reductase (NADPH) flavoprotein alpha-component
MVSPIQLPDDAPFTPAQRAWLNDFLTQTLAQGASAPQETAPSVPVTILFGSQTGTAESLAKKLFKNLKKGNYDANLHDMAGYDRARLPKEKNLLVITSTYGDGEPPDNAAVLHSELHSDEAPPLSTLQYSVFALGDSNYPDFCKCGHDFDQRLSSLGANRLTPIIECDVDFDEPFDLWINQLEQALTAA